MAPALASTNLVCPWRSVPTASPDVSLSCGDHQANAALGLRPLRQRHVADQSQLHLGRQTHRRSFSHSHRASLLPARGRVIFFNLLRPIEQVIRPTHCVRLDGSRRRSAQSLAHKQFLKSIAYVPHISRRLSSLASRWIDPNEIGLTHAQTFFASGANPDD